MKMQIRFVLWGTMAQASLLRGPKPFGSGDNVFHDLGTFEERQSVILQTVLQFGFL